MTVTIPRTHLYPGMMAAVIGATTVGTAKPLEAQQASTIVVSARVMSPGPRLPDPWRALLHEIPERGSLRRFALIRETRRLAETPFVRIDAVVVCAARAPHRGSQTASAAFPPKRRVRVTVSFIAN